MLSFSQTNRLKKIMDIQHVKEKIPEIQKSLDRSQQELSMLYEISCAMRTTLELKRVLYTILTGVTSHSGLGYNRALLFLADSKRTYLKCEMAIGPESGEQANKIWSHLKISKEKMEDLIQVDKVSYVTERSSLFRSLKDIKFKISDEHPGLLQSAFEKGTPWPVSQDEIKLYQGDPLLKHFPSQEMVIVPLRAKGQIIGLIVADNIFTQKPIHEEELRIFSMLADQAALAIENSRLYEMVVLQGHTDPVTGLWNHGYFQMRLSKELERASTDQSSLSLAMIDIDNFKKLNDTYGHQHGDLVLKRMAQIFQDLSRSGDPICRYGGEEFALILLGTDKAISQEIAERLRSKVAEHCFPSHRDDQCLQVTVSVGVATFPDDAQTKEELIELADKAMYVAKFSGKNKTCLANRND